MTRPLTLMIIDEDRFFAEGVIAWFKVRAATTGQTIRVITSLRGVEGPVLVFFTLRTSPGLPPELFTGPDRWLRLVCITTRRLCHSVTLPGFPWIPLLFRDTYEGGLPASGPAGGAPQLTRRQQAVLRCLATGMSARQTGDHLGISAQAVSSRKHNAMAALGLRNNQALLLWLAGPGRNWLTRDGYRFPDREGSFDAA